MLFLCISGKHWTLLGNHLCLCSSSGSELQLSQYFQADVLVRFSEQTANYAALGNMQPDFLLTWPPPALSGLQTGDYSSAPVILHSSASGSCA